MAVKTLSELFEHDLKDIYYAEHRLVDALDELAGESKSREIKRAFTAHKKETLGQIKRLKQVFKLFGEAPEAEKCPAIEGLLKEKKDFTKKEKPTPEILEYANLTAAAKTERYEITAYEALIEIAQVLGMDKAVELLSANLQEEEAALATMKTLSKGYDKGSLMTEEDDAESAPKGGGSGASSKPPASRASASKSASTPATSKATARKSSDSKSGGSKASASKASAAKSGAKGKSSSNGGRASGGSGAAQGTAGGAEGMMQTDPATPV
ncbi:MAG: hypothetical protein JWQ98_713 [Chlorobi bacterium]|nr:hypothetical protein [Chlorobiota bacterium]